MATTAPTTSAGVARGVSPALFEVETDLRWQELEAAPDVDSLNLKLQEERDKLHEQKTVNESLETKILSLEKKIAATCADFETKFQEQQAVNESLEKKCQEQQATNKALEKQFQEQQAAIKSLENQFQEQQAANKSLENQFQEQQTTNESLRARIASLEVVQDELGVFLDDHFLFGWLASGLNNHFLFGWLLKEGNEDAQPNEQASPA